MPLLEESHFGWGLLLHCSVLRNLLIIKIL